LDRRWARAGAGSVLWHAPSTFDTLVLELWLPLLNGGRVVVAEPGELDVDTLSALLAAHELFALWLPADLFSAVAARCPALLGGLREVWTGGDPVSATAVRRVRAACPELTIVTGHGPAEATVFAACRRPAADDGPAGAAAAVGEPMDNMALYALGPGLTPVPAGVVGELYVAGSGVARGYLGRPGLTARWFLPCPFGQPGGLMYRTGDRVRRDVDGRLQYVGRVDDRVLVRGVGVESAEIEQVLSEQAGVARSVVVARADESGSRRLVAYVVPALGTEDGSGLSAARLRRFAAGRLPEFMVPSVFVVLQRLPVTAGGRLDRASLPEPEFRDGAYRAPRNSTELVLAEAFADVLELDRVGIDEDFFELGGNSLRAIRLVGLIRSELKQEVSIRALFAARSIVGLSDMWNDLARSSRPALRRRTKDGEVV
jgi:nonribosomal peptide synthetase DhbF